MLCAANHQIPPFWLLLFSPDDLQYFTAEPGASATYPLLIGRREALLTRLETRMAALQPQLTSTDSELLQRWHAFLAGQNCPVLAVDTYELWRNREEPETLGEALETQLQQLEQIGGAADVGLRHWQEEGVWQAGNSIALCGYGW